MSVEPNTDYRFYQLVVHATENDHGKFGFIYLFTYLFICLLLLVRVCCHALFKDHVVSGSN